EVLIGGYSPRAARRVGRWGDGFISGLTSPKTALELYRTATESWREAARPGRPRFVGACFFALGPDLPERAARFLAHYFAPLDPPARGPGFTIATSAAALKRAVEARMRVGMDEVLLWPCIPDLDQVDRAAEFVAALPPPRRHDAREERGRSVG